MSARRATKALVNHHLFTQTVVDSGSLSMLGAVVHRPGVAGEYLGVAERGGVLREFRVTVDDASTAMQVDIDLASLESDTTAAARVSDCGCAREGAAPGPFVVNPEGYVLFHVSRGAGGYAVRLGGPSGEQGFDSTRLDGGDLFAVTLIRPGTYAVRNASAKADATGEIVVAYPKPQKQAFRPLDPIEIESSEKGLRPAKIRIHAAQGQVYRCPAPSRIVIELVRPNDGPKDGRPPDRPRRTVTRRSAAGPGRAA